MSEQKFEDLFSRESLREYLREKAFVRPTPVQVKLPQSFREKDLCVMAPTGSGKTLSYLLPLFDWLKSIEEVEGPVKDKGRPRAVVLAPTRELTTQITQVAKELGHHLKLRVRQIEGHKATKSARDSYASPFDILITAPGRALKDHKQKRLKLDDVRVVVLDEADQMLDTSFVNDLRPLIETITRESGTSHDVRMHLLTATAGPSFDKLRDDVFARSFESSVVESPHHLSVKLETFNIYLSFKEKEAMLETFLKREAKGPGVIFVNTKKTAQDLEKLLKESSVQVELITLHGEMEPMERREAHRRFNKGGAVLLATDIAARGLDQAELQWVLNFDLPFDPIYYIHRCGRVGRQGRAGLIYNFVTSKDLELIENINIAIERQTALDLRPLKAGPLKRSGPGSKKASGKRGSESKLKNRKVVTKKSTPRYKKKK